MKYTITTFRNTEVNQLFFFIVNEDDYYCMRPISIKPTLQFIKGSQVPVSSELWTLFYKDDVDFNYLGVFEEDEVVPQLRMIDLLNGT